MRHSPGKVFHGLQMRKDSCDRHNTNNFTHHSFHLSTANLCGVAEKIFSLHYTDEKLRLWEMKFTQ